MLFKKSGILATLAISTTLLAAPMISHAAAITITNNTGSPTTSKINGFLCSSQIPGLPADVGTTPPDGLPHVIDAQIVAGMCQFTPNSCTAVVYAAPNCGGAPIAEIVLSIDSGVVSAKQLAGFPLNAPLHGFSISLG